jgi:hypothetical protein
MAKRFRSESWNPLDDYGRMFESGVGSDFSIVCTKKNSVADPQIRETKALFFIGNEKNEEDEEDEEEEGVYEKFGTSTSSPERLYLDWKHSDVENFFDQKWVDFLDRSTKDLDDQVITSFMNKFFVLNK